MAVFFSDLTIKFLRYWRKRLFSGAGIPPRYIKNNEVFLKLIENNKVAIGIMKEKPKSSESIQIYEF